LDGKCKVDVSVCKNGDAAKRHSFSLLLIVNKVGCGMFSHQLLRVCVHVSCHERSQIERRSAVELRMGEKLVRRKELPYKMHIDVRRARPWSIGREEKEPAEDREDVSVSEIAVSRKLVAFALPRWAMQ
jgi:hypothetical protein